MCHKYGCFCHVIYSGPRHVTGNINCHDGCGRLQDCTKGEEMLEVDLTKGAHAGSRLFTPPWKPAVVIMLFALALKHFGGIDRALPVLSGITALALTFVTKWRLRRCAWFWIVMSIFVLAHVPAVVFAVSWERWVSVKGFGLVAVLDWLVMIWILGLVGRVREEHVIDRESHQPARSTRKRSRNPN
jgi:hypothetical protein